MGTKVVDDAGRAWRLGNEPRFFASRSSAVVKLHGSVNWFACHDVNGSGAAAYAFASRGLPPGQGYSAYLGHDRCMFTQKHSPEMLRGSLSKSHEYSYGMYSQLLSGFEALLTRADALVVAGFGWSDGVTREFALVYFGTLTLVQSACLCWTAANREQQLCATWDAVE